MTEDKTSTTTTEPQAPDPGHTDKEYGEVKHVWIHYYLRITHQYNINHGNYPISLQLIFWILFLKMGRFYFPYFIIFDAASYGVNNYQSVRYSIATLSIWAWMNVQW